MEKERIIVIRTIEMTDDEVECMVVAINRSQRSLIKDIRAIRATGGN